MTSSLANTALTGYTPPERALPSTSTSGFTCGWSEGPHQRAMCVCVCIYNMHTPHAHATCTCHMHMPRAHATCTCHVHHARLLVVHGEHRARAAEACLHLGGVRLGVAAGAGVTVGESVRDGVRGLGLESGLGSGVGVGVGLGVGVGCAEGLHLVSDHEHVIPRAQRAYTSEVAVIRHDHARLALEG